MRLFSPEKKSIMKKIISFLIVLAITSAANAQSGEKTGNSSPGKFFFGINYSYLNVDLKLVSMTKHSVWMGEDLGTVTLTDDEIDTLNSFVDYHDQFQGFHLSAGMILFGKPDNNWQVDGQLMLGLASKHYIITNTMTDSTEMDIKSETITPWYELGFDVRYKIDQHWGVSMSPRAIYSFGKTDEITDGLYPETGYLTETRENKFNTAYFAVNLLGIYTFKQFTISAGPGFHLFHDTHEYTINRENPENGNTFYDQIKSKMISESFFNGIIQLEWKFAPHFLFNAAAGISTDFSATAGIAYYL
jgi:hypothetical protein